MKCEHEDELTAFLDGELPPDREAVLKRHLDGCPGCAGAVALLRQTVSQLRAFPEPAPSAAVRRAVLTRIAQQPPPSLLQKLIAPRLWVPALALGAAAVAAFLVWTPSEADPGPLLLSPARMELAAHLEVLEDLELMGIESAEDLELLAQLDTLEGLP